MTKITTRTTSKTAGKKAPSKKKVTEKVFRAFLEQTKSTGDRAIDDARTDYLALEAFNEVAGDSDESAEMKRLRAQIMKHLEA